MPKKQDQRGDPFEQVARAADKAADEVLAEDRKRRRRKQAYLTR